MHAQRHRIAIGADENEEEEEDDDDEESVDAHRRFLDVDEVRRRRGHEADVTNVVRDVAENARGTLRINLN